MDIRTIVIIVLMFLMGIVFRNNSTLKACCLTAIIYGVFGPLFSFEESIEFSTTSVILGSAGIIGSLIAELGLGLFKKPNMISIK